MKTDLTLAITPKMAADAACNEKKALVGHLGTHFDVMNKRFPLDYTELSMAVFDVQNIRGRDIEPSDIDLSRLPKGGFAAFCTGFLAEAGYGTKPYFKEHPQLADALIDALLDSGVAIIGIDCAGVRRGAEHTPADRRCADRGAFVLENLCNLEELLSVSSPITAHTYPMNYEGVSGLPCRVVAEY